ncbi:hypothetical protein BDV96DRAFT_634287 [Lophiotrema nucula]|uniref:Uncharacterized protein n=1 Tax=Lophiotrema nucula TaxID=690887 RepID=A0A6A5Z146_9PLEO|nr:hypothetical protein BDV96DRAFT_634287 [Lophiotrema nucula]
MPVAAEDAKPLTGKAKKAWMKELKARERCGQRVMKALHGTNKAPFDKMPTKTEYKAWAPANAKPAIGGGPLEQHLQSDNALQPTSSPAPQAPPADSETNTLHLSSSHNTTGPPTSQVALTGGKNGILQPSSSHTTTGSPTSHATLAGSDNGTLRPPPSDTATSPPAANATLAGSTNNILQSPSPHSTISPSVPPLDYKW